MSRDFKGLRKVLSVSYFKLFLPVFVNDYSIHSVTKGKVWVNSYTSQLRSETDFSTS